MCVDWRNCYPEVKRGRRNLGAFAVVGDVGACASHTMLGIIAWLWGARGGREFRCRSLARRCVLKGFAAIVRILPAVNLVRAFLKGLMRLAPGCNAHFLTAPCSAAMPHDCVSMMATASEHGMRDKREQRQDMSNQ